MAVNSFGDPIYNEQVVDYAVKMIDAGLSVREGFPGADTLKLGNPELPQRMANIAWDKAQDKELNAAIKYLEQQVMQTALRDMQQRYVDENTRLPSLPAWAVVAEDDGNSHSCELLITAATAIHRALQSMEVDDISDAAVDDVLAQCTDCVQWLGSIPGGSKVWTVPLQSFVVPRSAVHTCDVDLHTIEGEPLDRSYSAKNAFDTSTTPTRFKAGAQQACLKWKFLEPLTPGSALKVDVTWETSGAPGEIMLQYLDATADKWITVDRQRVVIQPEVHLLQQRTHSPCATTLYFFFENDSAASPLIEKFRLVFSGFSRPNSRRAIGVRSVTADITPIELATQCSVGSVYMELTKLITGLFNMQSVHRSTDRDNLAVLLSEVMTELARRCDSIALAVRAVQFFQNLALSGPLGSAMLEKIESFSSWFRQRCQLLSDELSARRFASVAAFRAQPTNCGRLEQYGANLESTDISLSTSADCSSSSPAWAYGTGGCPLNRKCRFGFKLAAVTYSSRVAVGFAVHRSDTLVWSDVNNFWLTSTGEVSGPSSGKLVERAFSRPLEPGSTIWFELDPETRLVTAIVNGDFNGALWRIPPTDELERLWQIPGAITEIIPCCAAADPNVIVEYLEPGTTDDPLFVVQERLDGVNLNSLPLVHLDEEDKGIVSWGCGSTVHADVVSKTLSLTPSGWTTNTATQHGLVYDDGVTSSKTCQVMSPDKVRLAFAMVHGNELLAPSADLPSEAFRVATCSKFVGGCFSSLICNVGLVNKEADPDWAQKVDGIRFRVLGLSSRLGQAKTLFDSISPLSKTAQYHADTDCWEFDIAGVEYLVFELAFRGHDTFAHSSTAPQIDATQRLFADLHDVEVVIGNARLQKIAALSSGSADSCRSPFALLAKAIYQHNAYSNIVSIGGHASKIPLVNRATFCAVDEDTLSPLVHRMAQYLRHESSMRADAGLGDNPSEDSMCHKVLNTFPGLAKMVECAQSSKKQCCMDAATATAPGVVAASPAIRRSQSPYQQLVHFFPGTRRTMAWILGHERLGDLRPIKAGSRNGGIAYDAPSHYVTPLCPLPPFLMRLGQDLTSDVAMMALITELERSTVEDVTETLDILLLVANFSSELRICRSTSACRLVDALYEALMRLFRQSISCACKDTTEKIIVCLVLCNRLFAGSQTRCDQEMKIIAALIEQNNSQCASACNYAAAFMISRISADVYQEAHRSILEQILEGISVDERSLGYLQAECISLLIRVQRYTASKCLESIIYNDVSSTCSLAQLISTQCCKNLALSDTCPTNFRSELGLVVQRELAFLITVASDAMVGVRLRCCLEQLGRRLGWHAQERHTSAVQHDQLECSFSGTPDEGNSDDFEGQVGYRFKVVGTAPLVVKSLGRFVSANLGMRRLYAVHTLSLWDEQTSKLLGTAAVDGASSIYEDGFAVGSVEQPIVLYPGITYRLVSTEHRACGDLWFQPPTNSSALTVKSHQCIRLLGACRQAQTHGFNIVQPSNSDHRYGDALLYNVGDRILPFPSSFGGGRITVHVKLYFQPLGSDGHALRCWDIFPTLCARLAKNIICALSHGPYLRSFENDIPVEFAETASASSCNEGCNLTNEVSPSALAAILKCVLSGPAVVWDCALDKYMQTTLSICHSIEAENLGTAAWHCIFNSDSVGKPSGLCSEHYLCSNLLLSAEERQAVWSEVGIPFLVAGTGPGSVASDTKEYKVAVEGGCTNEQATLFAVCDTLWPDPPILRHHKRFFLLEIALFLTLIRASGNVHLLRNFFTENERRCAIHGISRDVLNVFRSLWSRVKSFRRRLREWLTDLPDDERGHLPVASQPSTDIPSLLAAYRTTLHTNAEAATDRDTKWEMSLWYDLVRSRLETFSSLKSQSESVSSKIANLQCVLRMTAMLPCSYWGAVSSKDEVCHATRWIDGFLASKRVSAVEFVTTLIIQRMRAALRVQAQQEQLALIACCTTTMPVAPVLEVFSVMDRYRVHGWPYGRESAVSTQAWLAYFNNKELARPSAGDLHVGLVLPFSISTERFLAAHLAHSLHCSDTLSQDYVLQIPWAAKLCSGQFEDGSSSTDINGASTYLTGCEWAGNGMQQALRKGFREVTVAFRDAICRSVGCKAPRILASYPPLIIASRPCDIDIHESSLISFYEALIGQVYPGFDSGTRQGCHRCCTDALPYRRNCMAGCSPHARCDCDCPSSSLQHAEEEGAVCLAMQHETVMGTLDCSFRLMCCLHQDGQRKAIKLARTIIPLQSLVDSTLGQLFHVRNFHTVTYSPVLRTLYQLLVESHIHGSKRMLDGLLAILETSGSPPVVQLALKCVERLLAPTSLATVPATQGIDVHSAINVITVKYVHVLSSALSHSNDEKVGQRAGSSGLADVDILPSLFSEALGTLRLFASFYQSALMRPSRLRSCVFGVLASYLSQAPDQRCAGNGDACHSGCIKKLAAWMALTNVLWPRATPTASELRRRELAMHTSVADAVICSTGGTPTIVGLGRTSGSDCLALPIYEERMNGIEDAAFTLGSLAREVVAIPDAVRAGAVGSNLLVDALSAEECTFLLTHATKAIENDRGAPCILSKLTSMHASIFLYSTACSWREVQCEAKTHLLSHVLGEMLKAAAIAHDDVPVANMDWQFAQLQQWLELWATGHTVRRLATRLATEVDGDSCHFASFTNTSTSDGDVRRLEVSKQICSMGIGFDIDDICRALQRNGDDADRTVDWLMTPDARLSLQLDAAATCGNPLERGRVNYSDFGGVAVTSHTDAPGGSSPTSLQRARNCETLSAVWNVSQELCQHALILKQDDMTAASDWLAEYAPLYEETMLLQAMDMSAEPSSFSPATAAEEDHSILESLSRSACVEKTDRDWHRGVIGPPSLYVGCAADEASDSGLNSIYLKTAYEGPVDNLYISVPASCTTILVPIKACRLHANSLRCFVYSTLTHVGKMECVPQALVKHVQLECAGSPSAGERKPLGAWLEAHIRTTATALSAHFTRCCLLEILASGSQPIDSSLLSPAIAMCRLLFPHIQPINGGNLLVAHGSSLDSTFRRAFSRILELCNKPAHCVRGDAMESLLHECASNITTSVPRPVDDSTSIESLHPMFFACTFSGKVQFPGAATIVLRVDPRTEIPPASALAFYADPELSALIATIPPGRPRRRTIVAHGSRIWYKFTCAASQDSMCYWGFKVDAQPIRETAWRMEEDTAVMPCIAWGCFLTQQISSYCAARHLSPGTSWNHVVRALASQLTRPESPGKLEMANLLCLTIRLQAGKGDFDSGALMLLANKIISEATEKTKHDALLLQQEHTVATELAALIVSSSGNFDRCSPDAKPLFFLYSTLQALSGCCFDGFYDSRAWKNLVLEVLCELLPQREKLESSHPCDAGDHRHGRVHFNSVGSAYLRIDPRTSLSPSSTVEIVTPGRLEGVLLSCSPTTAGIHSLGEQDSLDFHVKLMPAAQALDRQRWGFRVDMFKLPSDDSQVEGMRLTEGNVHENLACWPRDLDATLVCLINERHGLSAELGASVGDVHLLSTPIRTLDVDAREFTMTAQEAATFPELARQPITSLRCRLALLMVLNRYLLRYSGWFEPCALLDTPCGLPALMSELLWSSRHAMFWDIKQLFLQRVLDSSASTIRPSSRPTISLSNITAWTADHHSAAADDTSSTVFMQFVRQLRQLPRSLVETLLKAPLDERGRLFHIKYVGEDGIDYGGVSRDAMTSMVEELFSEKLPFFVPAEGADKYVPNAAIAGNGEDKLLEEVYTVVGSLMGVSLRNGLLLPFDFAPSVWMRLCELRMDSCCRGVDFFHWALTYMLKGILRVVPVRFLSLTTWDELDKLVAGTPFLDIDVLKSNTDYEGYSTTDIPIQLFWAAMESFSQSDRGLFMKFVWGKTRMPRSGHWPKRLKICRKMGGATQLPVSHTCFMSLEWPYYTSLERARSALLTAIHMSGGVLNA